MSHTPLQCVFIIGAIVRWQQELLMKLSSNLLTLTHIRECLDNLLRTIYLIWCYIAILGVPSLDHSCKLWLPMNLVILRIIAAIATPCLGSKTQSLAMPGGPHLQSMFTPVVPLGAYCLLSCPSVDPFLIFFLSTTVKSAISSCTASVDYGCSGLLPNTPAYMGLRVEAAEEGWIVEWSLRARWRPSMGAVEYGGWVGSPGVGGTAVWGGGVCG